MDFNNFNTLLNNNDITLLFDAQLRVVHYRLNKYLAQGYTIDKIKSNNLKKLVESLLDNHDKKIKYILSLD